MNVRFIFRQKRAKFFMVLLAYLITFVSFAEENNLKGRCSQADYIHVDCGNTPTSTFDRNNQLWVVFEKNGYLYVSASLNQGKSFSNPVRINATPEEIYTNGENRPKIAFGLNNEMYISWTKKTKGRFTGDIRFSRSLDGGKTFAEPLTVNDDGRITGHRFESMAIAKDGTIFVAWIDKRDNKPLPMETKKTDAKASTAMSSHNKMRHKKSGHTMPKQNGAIYYSYSTNFGASFHKNEKLAPSSCVCCRLAITARNDNTIAIAWRHIFFGSIRDHAFAIIGKQGVLQSPRRVSLDNWKIEACPHHGPSIAEDANQQLHLVWFTASEKRKGIFYGRLNAGSNEADNLINLSAAPSASHPYILSNQRGLLVVWKEFNGEQTQVMMVQSKDLGKNWSNISVLAETESNSDHPTLIGKGEQVWLSWLADKQFLIKEIERLNEA